MVRINFSPSWTVDGTVLSASGTTLTPDQFERDKEVQCHVVANDGESDSEVENQRSVIGAPSITGLAIDPPGPWKRHPELRLHVLYNADGDPDRPAEWTISKCWQYIWQRI